MISRKSAIFASFWAAVFGLSVFHNRRIYQSKTWDFVVIKSVWDTIFLALLVFIFPFLLICYSSSYVTEVVAKKTWQNRFWLLTVGAFVAIGLTMIGTVCMEAVALVSILPCNIITAQIWRKYKTKLETSPAN